MDHENPQSSLILRIWGAVRRSSSHAFMGVLISIPGLVLVYLIDSSATGFYIIAGAAMIAYSLLRMLDKTESELEDDAPDLSNTSLQKAVAFVLIMLTTLVIGVAVRLGVSAALAVYANGYLSQPVAAIPIAALFPVVDRKLALASPYISVSALAVLVTVAALTSILEAGNRIDNTSSRTVKTCAVRLTQS